MAQDVLSEIIHLALAIDEKAANAYQRLAENVKHGELRLFWHRMSEEEGNHIAYWNRLLKLARDGALEAADEAAQAEVDRALAELDRLPRSPDCELLHTIAGYVLRRRS